MEYIFPVLTAIFYGATHAFAVYIILALSWRRYGRINLYYGAAASAIIVMSVLTIFNVILVK